MCAFTALGGAACDGGAGDAAHATTADAAADGAGDAAAPVVPVYLQTLVTSSFLLGTTFGSPYDSILERPITSLQSALDPGFTTESVAGQLSGVYFMREVETSEDLYTSLNVSASLSVNAGAFGASAKIDYAQSKHLDTSKLYVFLDATTGGLAKQVVQPRLSAKARGLSPLDFYRNYGDRYVNEIVTGMELYGTIEIETSSQEDKQSLAVSLGLSYGASSFDTSYATTFNQKVGSRHVAVDVHTIGFTIESGAITDAASFFGAIESFKSYSPSNPDPTSQAIQLVYSSYYGLDGYPGVPAGTDVKVAQHQSAVSDYLLYDSLVTNDFKAYYPDPYYAASPFLAGMKAYRDALQTYLASATADSQSLPALPVIANEGKIEGYVVDETTQSTDPPFVLRRLHNGFVPKRVSDYEIPLKYAHDGALRGATFVPISSTPISSDISKPLPLDYQLYFVDKTSVAASPRRVVSYRWGTGTYFFDDVTVDGAPDVAKVSAAIQSLVLHGNGGSSFTKFVVVNKASGMVLSTDGVTFSMFQSPFTGSANQFWDFKINGCNNGETYSYGNVLYGRSVANNSLWWDIADNANTPGTAVGVYGGSCTDEQTFILVSKDNGAAQAIHGYGANGGSYIVVDPGASTAAPPNGAKIIIAAYNGYENQLWKLIPVEWIDTTP